MKEYFKHPEQLRIGTVLETYDCGYIVVEGITDEGVIARTLWDPHYLWTWQTLKNLSCLIYEQPAEDANPQQAAARWLPRVENRGGDADSKLTGSDREVDSAVACELRRLMPESADRIELEASFDDVGVLSLTIARPESSPIVANEALRDAVFRHHEFTHQCQAIGWGTMHFAVWRSAEGVWRYDVKFTYA
jgi:hypothetical protein